MLSEELERFFLSEGEFYCDLLSSLWFLSKDIYR